MHVRTIAVLLCAALLAACAKSQQAAERTTAAPTVAAATASPTPAFNVSPEPSTSPAESASPLESASPVESPSPTPTMPTPPPNLPAGWEKQYDRVENGPEADLIVRTGSIDNFGLGWPARYNPFTGDPTPAHEWVCSARPGAAPGTDRNELGTGVAVDENGNTKDALEGYSGCSHRPDNLPQAIPLTVGALPSKLHKIFIQAFVDDFQPVPFGSRFQVSLNGTRLPNFEDTMNRLDQTGPIGKLLTIQLLPEYWPILKSGTVDLLFDDPATGKADGYAVDFARIVVNPKGWRYAVTIACSVVDAATLKPIARADVSAGGVSTTTGSDGKCSLREVPAGLVSVNASAVNYDPGTMLLDLPAGQRGTADFQLKRHKEAATDLKQQLAKTGTVRVYGIHFDTASAKLRPDSTASLNEILQLIKSIPGKQWIIAGHTDNQGGAAYNMGLSEARAHSVVTWLVQHGISAGELTAKGYGLSRPIADNSTEAGRALNRRVEVSTQK